MKMGLGISLVNICAQAWHFAQRLYKIYLIGQAESTSLQRRSMGGTYGK